MSKNAGAIQQDIKNLSDKMDRQTTELRKEMREVMGEFTQEILGAISPEVQEIKADIKDLKTDVDELKMVTTRIENKLDATANTVDDHEVRIGRFEHQAA